MTVILFLCDAHSSRDWVDYVTLGATVLGIAVVGIYTYFARKQNELTEKVLEEAQRSNEASLGETQKSTALTREALVLNQRVWLNVQIGGKPLANRRENAVVIQISNVGRVPAAEIKFGASTFLADAETLADIPEIPVRPAAPIGVQSSNWYPVPMDLLEQNRHSILRKEKILHVLCRVDYDDGFGKPKQMRFGWFLTGFSFDEWRFSPGVHHIE